MAVAACAAAAPPAGAQGPRTPADSLVWAGHPYGSQATFSPLTVLLNKGFDHFQVRNDPRDFWGFPYGTSLRYGALDGMLHPGRAIELDPGWREWLRTEVLPLDFTPSNARWFVNYTEHLVGGGLTYRALGVWFDRRGFPAPRVWAGATTLAASLLNEAVEHPRASRASSSTVADLWVFDVGCLVVFNWDWPVRFFAGTLQATDWSNMAALTFPNGQLQNNGQYYVLKIPLPLERTRLFVRGGMGVQFGVSRRVEEEVSVTLALGLDTTVRDVDPVTLEESIGMAPGGGVYVDRNNSLLASLTLSPAENLLALNVYPGVLPGPGADVGVWAVYTRAGQLMAGVVHRRALGVGLGYGR